MLRDPPLPICLLGAWFGDGLATARVDGVFVPLVAASLLRAAFVFETNTDLARRVHRIPSSTYRQASSLFYFLLALSNDLGGVPVCLVAASTHSAPQHLFSFWLGGFPCEKAGSWLVRNVDGIFPRGSRASVKSGVSIGSMGAAATSLGSVIVLHSMLRAILAPFRG